MTQPKWLEWAKTLQSITQTGLHYSDGVFDKERYHQIQAIAAEMSDYSKRSFEQGTATVEKLLAAKSLEQAMEIQTSYARRAYEDYVQQLTKLGGMYGDLAREAYRPVERMMQAGR